MAFGAFIGYCWRRSGFRLVRCAHIGWARLIGPLRENGSEMNGANTGIRP
jgi:hypothetical protein